MTIGAKFRMMLRNDYRYDSNRVEKYWTALGTAVRYNVLDICLARRYVDICLRLVSSKLHVPSLGMHRGLQWWPRLRVTLLRWR